MHPITVVFLVVLGPPFLAYLAWLWIGAKAGNIEPWKRVRLGQYGFWIILGIIYTAALTTAVAKHVI